MAGGGGGGGGSSGGGGASSGCVRAQRRSRALERPSLARFGAHVIGRRCPRKAVVYGDRDVGPPSGDPGLTTFPTPRHRRSKPAYVPPHLRNRPAGGDRGGDRGYDRRDDRRGGACPLHFFSRSFHAAPRSLDGLTSTRSIGSRVDHDHPIRARIDQSASEMSSGASPRSLGARVRASTPAANPKRNGADRAFAGRPERLGSSPTSSPPPAPPPIPETTHPTAADRDASLRPIPRHRRRLRRQLRGPKGRPRRWAPPRERMRRRASSARELTSRRPGYPALSPESKPLRLTRLLPLSLSRDGIRRLRR